MLSLFFLPFSVRADTSGDILNYLNNSLDPQIVTLQNYSSLINTKLEAQSRNVEYGVKYLGKTMTGTDWTSSNPGMPSYTDKNNILYYLRALLYATYGTDQPNLSAMRGANSVAAKIGDVSSGVADLHADNLVFLALLQNISNLLASASSDGVGTNSINVNVTNLVQVSTSTNIFNAPISPDILAGNPWWVTNSLFTLALTSFSPLPRANSSSPYVAGSFPEVLSWYMSMRNASPGQVTSFDDLWNNWGYNKFNRQNMGNHAFEDFLAEAFKSNLVLLARTSSNVSATNDIIVNVAGVTNIINIAGDTNILNAADILAANPWWATNSEFASYWNAISEFYPYPNDPPSGYDFPRLFSSLVASIHNNRSPGRPEIGIDYWGVGGINTTGNGWGYTWFDAVVDLMKSNLVLLASSQTNDNAAADDYDDWNVKTNAAPLPEYVLEQPVATDYGFTDTARDRLNTVIDKVKPNTSGSDAEIVVIPQFSIGGVSVDEYKASLDYPQVTAVAHAVMSFLWGVMAATGIFRLIAIEWAYWSTLGHTAKE